MKHLVRHPRIQPFEAVGQFGLDNVYQPIRLLGRGGSGQTWLCRSVGWVPLVSGKLLGVILAGGWACRNALCMDGWALEAELELGEGLVPL